MTLLFAESFDDGLYNLGKWDTYGLNAVSNTYGRNNKGGRVVATSDQLMRNIAAADESDTLIVGCAFRVASGNTARDFPCRYIQLRSDSGATVHISLEQIGGTYNLNVCRGQGGTVLGVVSMSGPSIWHYVEVKVLLSDTVGTVDVHVDQVSQLSLTGQDTKNGGTKTKFDAFGIGPGNASSVGDLSIDDIYMCNKAGAVNNTFLGDCRVDVLYPNADGNYSQLVGSDGNSVNNYLLVDEDPPNTTDYVGTGAANGDKDTYNFADLPAGAATVAGVFHRMYGLNSDAGARSVRSVCRKAATDYTGADKALASTASLQTEFWELNPNTAALWTPTEVNAAEFGTEARA